MKPDCLNTLSFLTKQAGAKTKFVIKSVFIILIILLNDVAKTSSSFTYLFA